MLPCVSSCRVSVRYKTDCILQELPKTLDDENNYMLIELTT